MDNVVFNRCQTPLERLSVTMDEKVIPFNESPAEVQEQFWDFLNNVPFIKWMVSPDRPLISELPRDEKGRTIIDVTRPPILEGSDYFRQTAIQWQENKGQYTLLKPNANPNSEYGKWIREERQRGWDGYVNPDSGMWVTGDYYWTLNYCPMHLVEKRDDGLEMRTTRHPKFWDGQFLSTHYILQARQKKHHAAYLASRGKGKAHPYSQIVYTPTGAKQWGDIQVGDVLFGDDGKLTTVTAIPFDEEEKIYTVTLSDGRKLQCTSGHNFYVRDHRKHLSMQVVDLWQIMHSDYAHKRKDGGVEYYFSIPNNGRVEFNRQSVMLDPYTLGLLIGDGGLTNCCLNAVRFTSCKEDMETYKSAIPYEVVEHKAKHDYSIKIANISGILSEYRLLNTLSHEKFIPKEYLFNSSEVRLALLQGIMDTDGTVNNNGVPMLTTTSKQLAEDVRWLCHSLGYNSTMFTKQGKYRDAGGVHVCKLTYNITILTNDPIFKLQRKLEKLTNFESAYSRCRKDWVKIVDIKYSHREKAKCVLVDNESHCYLIGDFIVTHNTTVGGGMLSKRFIIGEFRNNQVDIQCLVTAADKTKLIGVNQVLSVFIDNIDFAAKNTQFPSRRLKSSLQDLTWQMGYKKSGSDVAYGSKNSVQGIISGVNQDKLNGSRGVLYIIEEAGIFKDLNDLYGLIRPSVEQGSSVFGEILMYGTAGNEQSDFTAFAEMFYSPDGYNLYGLDNVFDKEGQGSKKCCFFYPVYMNYDDSCIDENGNSDVTKALYMILMDRYKVKYGSTDINAITKRVSQYPITPQEAIIRSQGNMFPVTELNNRLNQIDNNPNEYDDVYVGELVQQKDGKVEFQPTGDVPIRDFPTKDNKVIGALEIYEMPQKNSEGKVPYDRYGFGCLKEGEMVNTEDGLKRVEDITLQDRLINIEGRFVDIINLQRYYNENPVYKVKLFSVYNSTTFSEEHPIYCATPKIKYHYASIAKREGVPYRYLTYDFQFRKVKDLKVGDVVKSPNVYRKEKSFMQYWVDEARVDRKIENPLDKGGFWWLLGLIIGDGWASKDGCNIHVCFNAREKQYIEQAKYIVENLLGRSFTLAKDRETCTEYQFCCQTLNAFIKKYIGCGAGNKQLAEWIKYIPEVLKKQLILGYLASDGSVTGNQVEFVSISLKLLCDMQDILFSIGIVSGVSRMKHYRQKEIVGNAVKQTKEKYHLRVDRTHAQIMKAWNPDDLKLSRCAAIELCVAHNYKRVWISDDLNYIYFKVASVEIEPYIGTVYNFECSTHTFMCNYIPTHNCDPFDDDESGTMSLGSIFVMDFWTDRIVAEYTGRPPFANELYEKVRLLCLFYNMKGLYENNLKGIFSYFSMRNCTYMLADTPEYLRDRQLITSIGYGNKSKGCRATTPIIKAGFRMIRDWLLKPVTKIETDAEGNEVEVTVPNLYNIRCRALLKELIQWNPYRNCDRIMALNQLMLYREEKMILFQGDIRNAESSASGMENDDYFEKNYPGKKTW